MRDASLAELGELSAHKPPMRGQKIFSQGKGLTAAHFLIPDITRNWTSTMLTRRLQGARRALAEAIDREERTREMDPLPMNPVVTRAAENNARDHQGYLPLFAPVFLLSVHPSGRWMVGAVGIELNSRAACTTTIHANFVTICAEPRSSFSARN